jgi:hypothetical protein
MTAGRITRLVFWLESVVAPGDPPTVRPGMADLPASLHGRFELALVADSPAALAPALDSNAPLVRWFDPALVYALPPGLADPPSQLSHLVAVGVLEPGHSLLIDPDPIRTMAAVRAGLDASIFVDTPRLVRDLALWGIDAPAPN